MSEDIYIKDDAFKDFDSFFIKRFELGRFSILIEIEKPDGICNFHVYEDLPESACLFVDDMKNLTDLSKRYNTLFLEGSVKWDGCSNWFFNPECFHCCGKGSAELLGVLMTKIYELTEKYEKDYDKQLSER